MDPLRRGDLAPPPRTLVDVFRATVEQAGDEPAVDAGNGVLTYAELAEAADELAHELNAHGVGTGDKVGVRVNSGTTDLYVAILGILLSGAAYVPVDVDDPDEADTTSKAGQTIDTDGWNGFLNDRLERNSNGTFAKENGNHIDKATGNYAYFGQIGSSYYYLTWPQPKAGTAEA